MTRGHWAVLAGIALSLGACKGKEAAPTGQVVATVDGQEITATELRAELGSARGANPEAQKQIEQGALQAIVNRKLLVAAAREEGVDKTPDFAVQRQRAEEMALIGALQQKLLAQRPKLDAEGIDRFVAEHPDSFAQRKIFAVDQLLVPNVQPAIVRQMEPLHSLGEIAQLLDRNNVQYVRSRGSIDGLTADPDAIKRVAAQAAGEPFVVPQGSGVTVNVVVDTRVEPVTGATARAAASQVLNARQSGDLVNRRFAELIRAGQGKVSYNATYQPAGGAPKGAASPAAGAAK